LSSALFLAVSLSAPQLLDRVAATVNDVPILFSEVQRRAGPELARMAMQDVDAAEMTHRRDDMFRSALQVIIDEQLLQEQLREANAEITDEQIDQTIADVRKQNNIPDDAAFEKALNAEGLTLTSYREKLKRDLEQRKLLNIKVTSQAKVSDEDIKGQYERQYVQAGGEEEVHARHILLAMKNTRSRSCSGSAPAPTSRRPPKSSATDRPPLKAATSATSRGA
jgi:peptidyl-prolyl cis-trans isomerase SurA